MFQVLIPSEKILYTHIWQTALIWHHPTAPSVYGSWKTLHAAHTDMHTGAGDVELSLSPEVSECDVVRDLGTRG